MNACLTVEFLAGTEIRRAAEEARAFAIKLDLAYVNFDFNGVSISVGKTADVDSVEKQYIDTLGKPHGSHKFILSN